MEKLIKGLYVFYHDEEPPRSHNINFLVHKIKNNFPYPVTETYQQLFQRLTVHYIEGRYPEYKENLGGILSDKTARLILDETKEVFEWLL